MNLRSLLIALTLVGLSASASATVKVYNSTPPGGTAGTNFLYTTTLCPPIDPTPGQIQGDATITDTGGGTVTLSGNNVVDAVFVDIPDPNLTGVFGPGAFVFLNSVATWSTPVTPAVAGSTAPGTGSVAWGVISGWVNTGSGFCIASPQTICTGGSMLPHGVTTAVSPPNSPTYDLGTWTFDASGDYSATAPYIVGTFNGGTSNRQRLLNGTYVGSSVPALPLIGAGVLALGLAISGTRAVLRRK